MTAFTERVAERLAVSMTANWRKTSSYWPSSSSDVAFGCFMARARFSVAHAIFPNLHRVLEGVHVEVLVATLLTSCHGNRAGSLIGSWSVGAVAQSVTTYSQ